MLVVGSVIVANDIHPKVSDGLICIKPHSHPGIRSVFLLGPCPATSH